MREFLREHSPVKKVYRALHLDNGWWNDEVARGYTLEEAVQSFNELIKKQPANDWRGPSTATEALLWEFLKFYDLNLPEIFGGPLEFLFRDFKQIDIGTDDVQPFASIEPEGGSSGIDLSTPNPSASHDPPPPPKPKRARTESYLYWDKPNYQVTRSPTSIRLLRHIPCKLSISAELEFKGEEGIKTQYIEYFIGGDATIDAQNAIDTRKRYFSKDSDTLRAFREDGSWLAKALRETKDREWQQNVSPKQSTWYMYILVRAVTDGIGPKTESPLNTNYWLHMHEHVREARSQWLSKHGVILNKIPGQGVRFSFDVVSAGLICFTDSYIYMDNLSGTLQPGDENLVKGSVVLSRYFQKPVFPFPRDIIENVKQNGLASPLLQSHPDWEIIESYIRNKMGIRLPHCAMIVCDAIEAYAKTFTPERRARLEKEVKKFHEAGGIVVFTKWVRTRNMISDSTDKVGDDDMFLETQSNFFEELKPFVKEEHTLHTIHQDAFAPTIHSATDVSPVNDQLDRLLKENKVDTLVIVGTYAEACVQATARAAGTKGYAPIVLEPAIGYENQRLAYTHLRQISTVNSYVTSNINISKNV